jgi:hypothetical protein
MGFVGYSAGQARSPEAKETISTRLVNKLSTDIRR